jgi:FlaA1/EpsC-like NDP-sugar epimerase
MTNRQKDQSLKIIFAVDLAVIYINFLFVYVYYNGWNNIPLNAVLLMVYISILWFFISINSNILNIDSQKTFVDIFKSQLGSSSVLSAGTIVVVAVFGNFRDNDKLILYSLLFIFFISLIYRALFLKGIKFVIRSGYKQKKALIIGGGHAAEKVMKQILSVPELGYRLYGIIADNYHESLPVGYYLGDFSRFYDTVRSHLIDEVIIALPLRDEKIIINMVERCESEGVRVRIVPDFFRIIRNRTTLERIGDIPLLSIRTEPLSLLRNRIVKRSFDIIFSTLALVVTSPLLLLYPY